VKTRPIVILSITFVLSLASCSKHISGRYVCSQDIVELKSDGTLSIIDAKSGAVAMKGKYRIKGDRISLIPEKGRTLNGVIQGDSITVEGLPPLLKERTN
jgi:hypothetical protein